MTRKKLQEIATIQAGYPFRGRISEVPGGPVKVVQMRDMNFDTKIDWELVMRTSYPKGRNTGCLKQGDIVFLARGGRFMAQALKDVPDETICSPHFFVIRSLRPEELSPEFLSWQINQAPAQQYLRREAVGSGQLSVRRPVLENLEVAIPAIDRQRQLLELADLIRLEQKVTAKILANRQQQLHALVQGLLSETLTKEEVLA